VPTHRAITSPVPPGNTLPVRALRRIYAAQKASRQERERHACWVEIGLSEDVQRRQQDDTGRGEHDPQQIQHPARPGDRHA
jgi:hypothetical protein